jgi:hypothetical protein
MLITKQNANSIAQRWNTNISFLILPSFIRHVKYEGRISRNSVQTVEEALHFTKLYQHTSEAIKFAYISAT